MNDDEQLDNILDEALSEYREAEPLAGLEDRVLQHLLLQPVDRRNTWLKWAAVAACAAALLVAIWIAATTRAARTLTPTREAAIQPDQTPQAPTAPSHAEESPSIAAKVAPRSSPRAAQASTSPIRSGIATPAQFPAPVPLTTEEQAFIAALARRPKVPGATTDKDDVPAIARIEIKPLSISDDQPGENQ